MEKMMEDEPMEDEQSKVKSNVTLPKSLGLFSSLKQNPSEEESQALLNEEGTPQEVGDSEKRHKKLVRRNIPDPKIKRNKMTGCET